MKSFGERILKRTPYGTHVDGVDVVLTVGDKALRMDYQTALQISAFLRHCARRAKHAAGDSSRSWTVVADLTDANADEMQAQLSRDGTAVYRS